MFFLKKLKLCQKKIVFKIYFVNYTKNSFYIFYYLHMKEHNFPFIIILLNFSKLFSLLKIHRLTVELIKKF